MRAFRILPKTVFLNQCKFLSRDALRRLEWIDWYFFHGRNAEATCRHFSLSKSVFYRWFKRFNKYNLSTLEFNTKTRRPHHTREMTTPVNVISLIYTIRKDDLEKSKYEIQEELKRMGIKIGYNTVQKIIARHKELQNVYHKNKVRKHRNYVIARLRAARELKEKFIGSLVQIDTKHLYILGKRFYLFVAVDCKSRLGFIWGYKTGSSLNAADFLLKVIKYFPFRIIGVNTDNGPEFLLNFHKLCESLGIKHYFTYPYSPKMNGRVERFIQTVQYEFFNWQDDLLPDINLINQRCIEFNQKYNTKRFHQSLHYKTPMEYVIQYTKEKGEQPFSI